MNKKLNKKQLVIVDWLLQHPGYLKKSAAYIQDQFDGSYNYTDSEKALIQAKLDHKKSLDDKLTYSKPNRELKKAGKD